MSDFIMEPASRVVSGGDTTFQHYFGGVNRYGGMSPFPGGLPLHMLYDFDTRDPLLPVKDPSVGRLPLCFGFAYNASAVAYRLTSDSTVELFYVEDTSDPNGFPYDPYPTHFEYIQVHLEALSYEEHKAVSYYTLLKKNLSEHLASAEDSALMQKLWYPFTQLGGVHLLWQDVPDVVCRNPQCANYRRRCTMEVFAVVWNNPVPGIALWDEDEDHGDDSPDHLSDVSGLLYDPCLQSLHLNCLPVRLFASLYYMQQISSRLRKTGEFFELDGEPIRRVVGRPRTERDPFDVLWELRESAIELLGHEPDDDDTYVDEPIRRTVGKPRPR